MKNYMLFGATGGIGGACAELLNEDPDVRLICIGHNREKLFCLNEKIGDRHLYYSINLEEKGSVENIFESACDAIAGRSGIDGVIFSAGIEGVRPVRVMSIDYFENVFRVNCVSFMQICRCMASKRYSNDGASMIAISSLTSVSLIKGEGAYGVSKAALNTTVKQAAMELIGRKIRVNAILPASTETDMMLKARERIPNFDQALIAEQPFGMIEPLQVAFLTEFLLSDKASYITGACIPISAGRSFY